MGQVPDFQMLETRLCPTLGKRKTDRADMRCLFRYPVKQVRHIIGSIKFLCQCDDVTAFACAKVIPKVAVCVHLKGRFAFFP